MTDNFSTKFFAGNRQKLRKQFDKSTPVVLSANGVLQRGADSTFGFFQDASFWYLTGINEPDLILVMDENEEYLIVPGRDESRQAFDGAVDDSTLIKHSGIKTILNEEQGWSRLISRLKKTARVISIPAVSPYIEMTGMYVNPARRRLIERMREVNPEIELCDLSPQLVQLRVIKQPVEIEAMQSAIDITIDTLAEICKPESLKKYKTENQMEADITRGFRYRGADGHAFEPIVAGGKRACTLHNVANDSPLKSNELVVLDVGAEVQHYAADITRTISLNSKPTSRQKAVHQAVLEVQDYALSLLKPGTFLKDYEQQVVEYMGKKLLELKLIKKIDRDAVRKYYPHATSHFIGLNVHDVGNYDKPLEAGMVVSCEPGIYIPEEGIGVRIEDDVLITVGGNKVMTARLPRDLS